jgi:septum formation topological specificity factor MinE
MSVRNYLKEIPEDIVEIIAKYVEEDDYYVE